MKDEELWNGHLVITHHYDLKNDEWRCCRCGMTITREVLPGKPMLRMEDMDFCWVGPPVVRLPKCQDDVGRRVSEP